MSKMRKQDYKTQNEGYRTLIILLQYIKMCLGPWQETLKLGLRIWTNLSWLNFVMVVWFEA